MSSTALQVRELGCCDYVETQARMRAFTHQRDANTADELWLLQHPPVFTQGQAGRPEHLLAPGDIPVIHSDRGGQVTYHGPGQVVIYCLLDLHRLGFGIRSLVSRIEQCMIDTLSTYSIKSFARPEAPGVYVEQAFDGVVEARKIGALGLRVRRGCTYHGLALNVDMDLSPFARINPCGYAGLRVTQLKDLGGATDCRVVGHEVVSHLQYRLRANTRHAVAC